MVVWSVSRLKAPIRTRSCELRLELEAACCGKCLKILPGSSDPTSWFCAVLQSPKRYISDSNLTIESRLVDTSAGLIVPKTVLTCNIFSTTRFWSQSTLQLKCVSNVQHLDVTKLHVQLMSPSTNTWECVLKYPTKNGPNEDGIHDSWSGSICFRFCARQWHNLLSPWWWVYQASSVQNCTSRHRSSGVSVCSPVCVTEDFKNRLLTFIVTE